MNRLEVIVTRRRDGIIIGCHKARQGIHEFRTCRRSQQKTCIRFRTYRNIGAHIAALEQLGILRAI
jgi:hypothetical protein